MTMGGAHARLRMQCIVVSGVFYHRRQTSQKDGRRPSLRWSTNAFDELLQELGSQLSKTNLDSLEVLERVPEDMREKGGIKLLEYFRNQGRFSLWRTASLHDILRKCGRYDLAQVVKDRYQTKFPDLKGKKGGGAATKAVVGL